MSVVYLDNEPRSMSTASLVVACVGMQHGVRQWLHEEGWLKFTGLNWTTGETYSQPFWDRAISEAMHTR